jgi:hypothetical protein
MIEDDLEVLVGFRSGVPAPDEETVQRIYLLATSPRPRWRVLLRARLSRPPRLALAVALLGFVLVPAALAFGGKIVDLFEGTPAPPAVSTTFEGFNRFADATIREGFARQSPHADVSKAHGVMEIQTADGPQDLWAAPNDQGGLCWFIDFDNDRTGSNGQPGFGTCDTPSTRPASNITLEGPLWMLAHPSLYTVDGRVYVGAATVELARADGSTATLPVVEGLFLGSFDSGANVTQVTAYDKTGAKVAQRTLP